METDKSAPGSSLLEEHKASVVFAQTWSHSNIKISKICHTWTISNFSCCPDKVGERLHSAAFSDGKKDNVKWQLLAYRGGNNEKSKDYFSLFVKLAADKESEILAKFELSILNEKGEKSIFRKAKNHRFRLSQIDWGFPEFVKRDFLFDHANGLLPNDTLTIHCEITVFGDTVNVSGMDFTPNCKDTERSILKNLGLVFDTQQFSDVTLVVGDRELKAHKAILAAQSPVFFAMFNHDMEERKQNRVDIIDLDDKVLEEMLRFIYTGKVANIETLAPSLLVAADKYAIDSLKLVCEASLCKSLTKESVTDMLVLADLHNADRLKNQVMNFIKMHTDVLNSAGFKSTLDLHPCLVAETLRVLSIWRNDDTNESAQTTSNS